MPKEETIEIIKLSNAVISKTGITSSDGHPMGMNTIVDVYNLTEIDDYWKNQSVVIIDGNNRGLSRKITSYSNIFGTLEVYPSFPYNVLKGTSYKILSDIITFDSTRDSFINYDTTLFNGVAEQLLFSLVGDGDCYLRLDLSNITQNLIIREYDKIDTANYRQLSAVTFPIEFDTGTTSIDIDYHAISGCQYKITLQSVIAEGANRSIKWAYRTDNIS